MKQIGFDWNNSGLMNLFLREDIKLHFHHAPGSSRCFLRNISCIRIVTNTIRYITLHGWWFEWAAQLQGSPWLAVWTEFSTTHISSALVPSGDAGNQSDGRFDVNSEAGVWRALHLVYLHNSNSRLCHASHFLRAFFSQVCYNALTFC